MVWDIEKEPAAGAVVNDTAEVRVSALKVLVQKEILVKNLQFLNIHMYS